MSLMPLSRIELHTTKKNKMPGSKVTREQIRWLQSPTTDLPWEQRNGDHLLPERKTV
jgi:hypothetical protein